MNEICILCGSKDVAYPPLCKECFLKREHFTFTLPAKVKLKTCKECGRLIPGGGLFGGADDLVNPLRHEIEKKTVVEGQADGFTIDVDSIEMRDGCQGTAQAILTVILKGQPFERRAPVTFRMAEGCCDECSRMRGGFFEAVVQVRGTGRALRQAEAETAEGIASDMLSDMREQGAINSFISKVAFSQGGLDLYIGGNGPGRAVAERLAEAFQSKLGTVTATLYGEKDGRKLYRTTFLVRLPMAKVGDVVLHKEDLLQVLGGRNSLDVVNLRTGARSRMEREELEKGEVAGGEEDLLPAAVVAFDAGLLQVVDPKTNKTVAIKPLEEIPPGTSEVWTFRLSGELFMAYRRN